MVDDEDTFSKVMVDYLGDHPYTQITYKRFSDFDEYEKLILNELAEGEGPDIFAMPNSWFVKNRKKLVPMPESEGTSDDFKTIFVDVATQDLVMTDDNGIERAYGIPLYVDTLALYYNKDHFEDRLPGVGKPSPTWSGIKGNVISLMKEGEDEIAVSGIAMGNVEGLLRPVDVLYALMIQHGVVFYDGLMKEAIFADSNEYAASDALEFYSSFADPRQRHYGWDDDIAADYLMGDVTAFVSGKVSMMFGFANDYDLILSQRKIAKTKGVDVVEEAVIKVAPFPQIYDPKDSTKKRDTLAVYDAFAVARTSEYSEEAWRILGYLADKDTQANYFELTNKPSGLRSLIAQQKLHPTYGVFAEQTGYAESFPVLDVSLFYDWFSQAIELTNDGEQPRTGLKQVQDKVQEMLPDAGLRVPINIEYYEKKADGEDVSDMEI